MIYLIFSVIIFVIISFIKFNGDRIYLPQNTDPNLIISLLRKKTFFYFYYDDFDRIISPRANYIVSFNSENVFIDISYCLFYNPHIEDLEKYILEELGKLRKKSRKVN